jgi:uncharacterized Fe-S cluster-containing protein
LDDYKEDDSVKEYLDRMNEMLNERLNVKVETVVFYVLDMLQDGDLLLVHGLKSLEISERM